MQQATVEQLDSRRPSTFQCKPFTIDCSSSLPW